MTYKHPLKQHQKHLLTLGTATASMVLGNAAYASIISYENTLPGGYDWMAGTGGISTLLDITRSPGDQALGDVGQSFIQYNIGYYFSIFSYMGYQVKTPSDVSADGMNATAINLDDIIDASVFNGISEEARAAFYLSGNPAGSYPYLGDGTSDYLGLKFLQGADTYYGWIEVLWNPTDARFDALAWGYETVADTAIKAGARETAGDIPEPGTLGLFAVGVTALAVARRRKKQQAEDE